MRPLYRKHVNKSRSSRQFRNNTKRTKKPNITSPMRGGIRL